MPADPSSDVPTFGSVIQRLRRERVPKLTQRAAAESLGIDFTYLSKLENDRGGAPGADTVRKMAALYEADPEYLLALAGKVPVELRQRASEDRQFAQLLRRLPNLPEDKLRQIYKSADVPDES